MPSESGPVLQMEATSVGIRNAPRAVHVQLSGARKTSAFALIRVRGDLLPGLPQCPQSSIQCVRDDAICLAGRVLVDDRRVHAVVAHPRHEVACAHPGGSCEGVPCMPQIVKVKSRRTDGLDSLKPCLLYTSPSPRDGLLSRMPSS